jgi:hypothetical protein
MLSLIVMSMLGALAYNLIGYGNSAWKTQSGVVSGNKIARTCCAGLVQAGLWCIGAAVCPAIIIPVSIWNAVMVNGFAAYGIDKLFRRIGWK